MCLVVFVFFFQPWKRGPEYGVFSLNPRPCAFSAFFQDILDAVYGLADDRSRCLSGQVVELTAPHFAPSSQEFEPWAACADAAVAPLWVALNSEVPLMAPMSLAGRLNRFMHPVRGSESWVPGAAQSSPLLSQLQP